VNEQAIARLLHPYATLDGLHLHQTSIYIDLLLKWNSKINLTAIRDPQQMVTRHFGESFFAASCLVARDWEGTVIDVGSGAGFPGLPLAMYAPSARVTVIESRGKKAAFLNEVIFALGLKNAKVFRGRAEAFPESVDLVTMRAVERFENTLPVAEGLVRPGGRLALMIGGSQVSSAEQLAPNLKWHPAVAIPGGESRLLLVGTKLVNVGHKTGFPA
jgi:16S rRNA (guanine527-N7)-methyltransferase